MIPDEPLCRSLVSVNEYGEIIALFIKEGVLLFNDGDWVRLERPVFGDELMNSRRVTDEEWAVLSKSVKSTIDRIE